MRVPPWRECGCRATLGGSPPLSAAVEASRLSTSQTYNPMKIKRKTLVQQTALAALGVFLGRGAHADTIIDFDFGTPPPRNALITHPFGDSVSNSSDGVTVVGFGTPNIGVSWEATGDPATECRPSRKPDIILADK